MNRPIIDELETPCVLLDYNRLKNNIRNMQENTIKYRIVLRPHIKTHKCLQIANMQIKEGAIGITTAKTDEAIIFICGGIKSVTVAYPIIQHAKLDRLFKATIENGTELRMVVDSVSGIDSLSRACKIHNIKIDVFIEIDVGLNRCGVQESDPNIMRLVHMINDDSYLNFTGLISHAGHAYAAKNAEEITRIASEECSIMQRVCQNIQNEGIKVSEVSVGATPTALVSSFYQGITEIRPGNYAFMDLTPARQGLISQDKIALSVLATIVSVNNNYFIIDAGSKTLSSDLGAHGLVGAQGYGIAYKLEDFNDNFNPLAVVKLSEEHGFLKRNNHNLKIGEKVRIFPNHACPVANLSKEYLVIEEGRLIDRWSIDARGCVL